MVIFEQFKWEFSIHIKTVKLFNFYGQLQYEFNFSVNECSMMIKNHLLFRQQKGLLLNERDTQHLHLNNNRIDVVVVDLCRTNLLLKL